jgi:hypothetical protein
MIVIQGSLIEAAKKGEKPELFHVKHKKVFVSQNLHSSQKKGPEDFNPSGLLCLKLNINSWK